MGRINTHRIKTKLTVTDPCGVKLFLHEFTDQQGKVIKITNKDNGLSAAIYMDDKAMRKLQRCLDKMFSPKVKQGMVKKIEKATRVKTVCKENINQFDEILQAVCSEMDLMPEAVLAGRRFRVLSEARMIISHLVRKHTTISYPDLADLFGEKTHASSLIRVRKYKRSGHTRRLKQIAQAVESELGLGKTEEKQTG